MDGSKYHTSSIAYRSDQQHNAKKQTSAQSMQRNKSQKPINAGYLYTLDRLAQYKHTSINDWVAQIMPFSILLASTFIRRVAIPQHNNQCYRYIELLLFFLMHLHKHEEELMLQKPGFVVKEYVNTHDLSTSCWISRYLCIPFVECVPKISRYDT